MAGRPRKQGHSTDHAFLLVLARIYARGLGVPQDVNKALALLKGNPREDARAYAKELSAAARTNAAAKKP